MSNSSDEPRRRAKHNIVLVSGLWFPFTQGRAEKLVCALLFGPNLQNVDVSDSASVCVHITSPGACLPLMDSFVTLSTTTIKDVWSVVYNSSPTLRQMFCQLYMQCDIMFQQELSDETMLKEVVQTPKKDLYLTLISYPLLGHIRHCKRSRQTGNPVWHPTKNIVCLQPDSSTVELWDVDNNIVIDSHNHDFFMECKQHYDWDPTGRLIPVLTPARDFFTSFWDTQKKKVLRANIPGRPVSGHQIWDHTGTYIVTRARSLLYVTNVKTVTRLCSMDFHKDDGYNEAGDPLAAWHPKKHTLAICPARGSKVKFWDLDVDTNSVKQTPPPHYRFIEKDLPTHNAVFNVATMQWSPCGRYLMTTTSFANIPGVRVYDTATKHTILLFSDVVAYTATWHPRHNLVAITTRETLSFPGSAYTYTTTRKCIRITTLSNKHVQKKWLHNTPHAVEVRWNHDGSLYGLFPTSRPLTPKPISVYRNE